MHAIGKRILEVDGFHAPIAWLYRGDDRVQVLLLAPDDHQDKVVQFRRLAQEIERTGANTVLFTSEAWTVADDEEHQTEATLRPSERADRGEALVTFLLHRRGGSAMWTTPFERGDNDRLVLQDTSEVSECVPSVLLAPVVRVWEGWPSEADK